MSLAELTQSINAATERLTNNGPANEEERQVLMAATEKLKLALESPLDVLIRVAFGVCTSPRKHNGLGLLDPIIVA